MGCISVQHKCCLHSMVAVTCLLSASLTSKCADTSDGTASALAIFVCLYQQNLFWYQQDPYIPTGAKLYLQNPKGTHTVALCIDDWHPMSWNHSALLSHRTVQGTSDNATTESDYIVFILQRNGSISTTSRHGNHHTFTRRIARWQRRSPWPEALSSCSADEKQRPFSCFKSQTSYKYLSIVDYKPLRT